MAMSEKHLPPRKQSVCSSHGLDDKGGGEKGHEGEEDEDDGGKKVASIFEGRWQCEGSSAYYQIEDVDKTCKKTSTSSRAGDFGPVRRLY